MITIGLDVSTSITGIAIFNDSELISTISVNTTNKKKYPEPVDVAFEIRRIFKSLAIHPDKVIIEESLKGFARGFSSANTIITLSQINGLVCFIVEDIWAVKPEKISAKKARKKVGIIIPPKTDRNVLKKIVLDEMALRLENFTFNVTIHGNPQQEAYDRADAAVVALSSIMDD